MFERIYAHPLHNPGFFWLVGLPVLIFLLRRLGERGSNRRFVLFGVAFQIAILLDAALQGELSPLTGATRTAVSIAFVILGDLRFFLLLERFGRAPAAPLWRPLASSLAVPVASTLARPLLGSDPRQLFLLYELTFALIAVVVLGVVLPRRDLDPPVRRWMTRLTCYELVQYLGWAAADVLILRGHDVGYLLRLLPNGMYYAGFIPFAWLTAPRPLRS